MWGRMASCAPVANRRNVSKPPQAASPPHTLVPELPEVEPVVRTLAPYLIGRTIVSARFTSRFVTPGNRAKLARQVAGRRIESVTRRGKFIVVGLDQGELVMHLGMTGKLLSAGIETT